MWRAGSAVAVVRCSCLDGLCAAVAALISKGKPTVWLLFCVMLGVAPLMAPPDNSPTMRAL